MDSQKISETMFALQEVKEYMAKSYPALAADEDANSDTLRALGNLFKECKDYCDILLKYVIAQKP